ncbi:hypothetical protein ABW20_dc0102165 [Dactylellina cionopaga]|nr:hypothetical protein ABW20_dc0102165 [Dactylellina cionopaga]
MRVNRWNRSISINLRSLSGIGGLILERRSACSHPRLNLPSKYKIPTSNTFQSRTSSSVSAVPAVESCPCSADLECPEIGSLEIDQKSPIAGVITRHYRHVLIHTGTNDWAKRVESEEGSVASVLKPLISRRGMFVDPFYPILVTNASFPLDPSVEAGSTTISIFPEGVEITSMPNTAESLKSFVTSFLLPPSDTWSKTRTERSSFATKKITKPVILTCSHGSRDERCGILGPVISKAFRDTLESQTNDFKVEGIVGEISHIGGHKFAGNVIIHLPAEHELSKTVNESPTVSSPVSSLMSAFTTSHEVQSDGGVAIWYGRVMPYHADGILDTTIRKGKVIRKLLRGVVNSNGDLVDLQNTGLVSSRSLPS